MLDQNAPDPQFDVMTARLLRREALRRAAEELNTTSGPGTRGVLAQISAEVTAEAACRHDPASGKAGRVATSAPLGQKRPRPESDRMPRKAIYLLQAFKAGKGIRLAAETPTRCKSSEGARRTAEHLALTKAGAVALATSGDAESGDYDEKPAISFKAGHLLAPFEEA